MRILHVIGDSEYGGGSRVIEAIAVGAQQRGHEVEVLTTAPRFQEVLSARNIAVLDRDWIRRAPHPWVDARGVTALASHLRRGSYDLVHTHTTRGGLLGRLAARLAGTPAVVHTAHGFAVAEADAGWKRRAYFAVERRAAPWGDFIVTVSDHHRAWAEAERLRPRTALRSIPNGVPDPLPDGDGCRPTPPLPEVDGSRTTLLHFGRIAGGKGIDVLLAALREVHDALRPRERPLLLVAGDGPILQQERGRAAAYGLASHVRWLGHRDDLPALLARADLVIFPSLREGLSLALLEAMAAGRPIVATSLGGNAEALAGGACGRLVPPGDPRALATGILELIDDPARAAAAGRAARSRFERTYRLEQMVQRYMDLYEEASAGTLGPVRSAVMKRRKSAALARR